MTIDKSGHTAGCPCYQPTANHRALAQYYNQVYVPPDWNERKSSYWIEYRSLQLIGMNATLTIARYILI